MMLEDRYKVAKAAAKRAAKTRAAGARPTKLMQKPKRNPSKKAPGVLRRSARLGKRTAAQTHGPALQHLQRMQQDLCDQKLESLENFRTWCMGLSTNKKDLVAAYDDHDRIVEILSESKDDEGILWYQVCWSVSYMPQRHLDVYKFMRYQSKAVVVRHDMSPSFAWDSHVLEVHWEPTHALATTVEDQPESEDLLAAHMLRVKACHASSASVRCDLDLTSLQQQGHEPRQQVQAMPWSPELAAKVYINTLQSVNPDIDMMPTGHFAIHMQQGMAHIILPDGTFSGSLTKSRLDTLYRLYTNVKAQRPSSTPADFAEAVSNLLARYKDGFEASAGNKTKLCNHWATPDVYMLALAQGLNIHTERFASPLNCSPHLQAYFSRYSDDKLFGANLGRLQLQVGRSLSSKP